MRLLQGLLLVAFTIQLYAVPARWQYVKVRMNDGTMQTVRFCGDEHRHFYLSKDGYIVEADSSGLFYKKTNRRPEQMASVKSTRYTGIGSWETAPIRSVGNPQIPVVLVNFSDVKFTVTAEGSLVGDYYDKYCNGTRDGMLYSGAGSRGAVRDYFVQQSDSLFKPEFTVIGPITLSRPMAYYGKNEGGKTDVNFREFCQEALQEAMKETDWKPFDNNEDGTVDMAFFIYAGLPESDYGVTSDAIWPKEFISPVVIEGQAFSVMACCSELSKSNAGDKPSGIGTMCHEIAHSLGLPDMYDVNYKALGMSYWSLMDSGNYCDNGYIPCGMTSYERDFLKWRKVEELTESGTVRLRPMERGGIGYKIVNPHNEDEYYIVENRQFVGWDSGLSKLGHGMQVTHVDYDQQAWTTNRLNVDGNHQRMSFIPANNKYIGPYNADKDNPADFLNALSGQLYPGASQNRTLTDASLPAAKVFAGGFMRQPITGIQEMDNGDIVFKFKPKGTLVPPEIQTVVEVQGKVVSLKWDVVPGASCYTVQWYGVNKNGTASEDGLLLLGQRDSIETNFIEIRLEEHDSPRYDFRVMAMADTYEDSPYSLFKTVYLSEDAIMEATSDDDRVKVYSMNGVYLKEGLREEVIRQLNPGIYILWNAGKYNKISVKE